MLRAPTHILGFSEISSSFFFENFYSLLVTWLSS